MLYRYLFILVLLLPTAAHAACRDDKVTLRGDWGEVRFSVEVADDPAERGLGLMNRPSMSSGAGMLFIYEAPQSVSFWMKNTLIPLDMLFFDETGQLQRLHENAIPGDLTPIPGGEGIQYVLEINGGLSRRLGIVRETELQHPAISSDVAVWPCLGS